MKKEEIHFPDWERLFLGNTPWEFMLEVAVRTLVIYVVLLVVIRLLGKRMGAQMTITEMAIMITLGAIVSMPMQAPDRGIVHGLMVLIMVVIFQVGLGRLSFRKKALEILVQGDVVLLVKEGIINIKELKKAAISHEQLYAELRCSKKIMHLGQIDRVYLEACGLFSVFTNNDPKPGLSIIPSIDKNLHKVEYRVKDNYACINCGNIVVNRSQPHTNCTNCGEERWIEAVNLKTVLEENKKEESVVNQEA